MSVLIFDQLVFDQPYMLLCDGNTLVKTTKEELLKDKRNKAVISSANWNAVHKYFCLGDNLSWPPTIQKNVYGSLGVTSVPWNWCVNPKKYFNFVVSLSKELINNCNIDYINTYEKGNVILKRIGRMKINKEVLLSCDEKQGVLDSFLPYDDGLTTPARYTRLSTTTGRLSVTSGPQLGLLKKENRNIISSRFASGKIVCLDFKSVEPRIIACGTGNEELASQKDIYGWFAEKQLGNRFPRSTAKDIVIKRIYGAGYGTIASGMVNDRYLDDAIEAVDDCFGIQKLNGMLLKEAKETGMITTHFGAKLDVAEVKQHALVNYWGQRSSMDLMLWLFSDLYNKLDHNQAVPVASLVDAMIFDTHPEYVETLCRLAKEVLERPAVELGIKTPFYVEINTEFNRPQ